MDSMVCWSVYMHTSPSGKRYIGITCQDVAKRWGSVGQGYTRCKYFYRTITKYGWDSITHEVVYTGLTEEEAKQSEKDLIIAYKTRSPLYGYNLTDGGDGACGCIVSAETRAKLSAANKGKQNSLGCKPTAETRAKLSAARMGNQNTLGYKHTSKTKALISAAHKGRVFSAETRAKLSAAHAGENCSAETRAKLSAASKGNQYNLGSKRTDEAKQNMRDAQARRAKDVECATTGGEIVGHYTSCADAAEKTGICDKSISAACRGKIKTAGSFKWRYVMKEVNDG